MPTVAANTTEKEGTAMPATTAPKKRVRRPARAASTNEETVTNTGVVEANDASDEENEEGVAEGTDEDLDLDADADEEEPDTDPTVVMTVDAFENCNMMDLFKQMCDLEPDVIDGVQLTKIAGDTTLVVQFAHLKLQIVS